MRESTVARSYAEALFTLGERHGEQRDFAGALDEVAAVLEAHSRIRDFLETPKVEPAAKKRVLREALRERVSPLFMNFLLVVLEKRRQRLLVAIAREYHALLDERLGRLHARVTLAREPDARTKEQITSKLSRALDRTVIPHVRVDAKILGGIVVRHGDRVLDGSLRRQLMSLRQRMLEAELPEGV